jgi:hypothetical protein
MTYTLEFKEQDGYLYACVDSNEISFEMVIEYTNKIIQRIKETGHSRLLLRTSTPVLDSTDGYEIASYIVRNAISSGVRIAVVDTSDGHERLQEKITGASRAAGIDIRSFVSMDTAIDWLLSDTVETASNE